MPTTLLHGETWEQAKTRRFRDEAAWSEQKRLDRLAESADDMLAALEAALPIIDAYRRISGGDGDLTAMNIRAAIAKAKGEQQ